MRYLVTVAACLAVTGWFIHDSTNKLRSAQADLAAANEHLDRAIKTYVKARSVCVAEVES